MKGLDKSKTQRQIESITGQSFDDIFESARRGLLRRITAVADPEEVFTSDRGEALTELLDLLGEGKEVCDVPSA